MRHWSLADFDTSPQGEADRGRNLAAAWAAAPVQAQGRAFMWRQATANNSADKTISHSALFSAGAWKADRKARAFKHKVEDEEISAAKVTARCRAPARYEPVGAARNAATQAAPDIVLTWEG
jgi:hypothetical protein